MRENIIPLGSVTHALKARDLLSAHGIWANIIKTPDALSRCGCGYSVAVRGDVQTAKNILSKAQLKILPSD